MADPLNTRIAEALLEQQLRDAHVETALRRRVWQQLAQLEADILAILKLSDPTQFALLARRRREVEVLMEEEMAPLIQERYGRLAMLLDGALLRIAEQEAEAVEHIVNEETEEETIGALPTSGQLRGAVEQTPLPTPQRPTDIALPGAEWWQRQGVNLSDRIKGQLLVAVALAESLTQASQRIRGTAELGFQDGIMARVKDDAARLIRTQVTSAVTQARLLTAARNPASNLVAIHQSILDSRTSSVCLSRHGLQYDAMTHEPLGHSIPFLTGPPYHPNCRSTIVVGLRGGGPIMEANLTRWLQGKSTVFQNELLGPTRAQMWREGRLGSVRNLVDALTGKPLTLEELGI